MKKTTNFAKNWKKQKKEPLPKKSSRILRQGKRLEKHKFIDEDHKGFGTRWLLCRFRLYPNSHYGYRKKKSNLSEKQRKE